MKKGKLIAGSVLSIVMCSSLIAGATMALFTSESTTNVAITSGNVDITANILDGSINTYSAHYGQAANATEAITSTTNPGYYYQTYTTNGTGVGTFYSGSAKVNDDGGITLTNMLPGDKISFDIQVESTSNVTISYRSLFKIIEDDGLYSGLIFSFNKKVKDKDTGEVTYYENEYTTTTGSQVSDWETAKDFETIYTATIELPIDAGNTYKDKTCKLSYAVEAVQGNAAHATEATVTVGETVTEYKSFAAALQAAASQANSVVKPTTVVSYAVVIPENKGLTIDLNGTDISVVGTNKSFAVQNSAEGTTATLNLNNVTINGVYDTKNTTALASALTIKSGTIKSGTVKVNAVGVNTFNGAMGGSGIDIQGNAEVTITGDTIHAYGNNKKEYVEPKASYKDSNITYSNVNEKAYNQIGGSGIAITSTSPVTISGVKSIIAEGYGERAFGIGGDASSGSNITIENTKIDYARGGYISNVFLTINASAEAEGGAAIGLEKGTLTLNNVIVEKAEGGSKCAAIGGIYHNQQITVNINNSTLKEVIGGNAAAAIGGGRATDETTNTVAININSSTINALGGTYGAGIGSGYDTACSGYPEVTIKIDQNIVDNKYSTITAVGGDYAAGIGTGYHVAHLYCVIAANTSVNATAGKESSNTAYSKPQDIGFGVVDKTREYAGQRYKNESGAYEWDTKYPGEYYVKVGEVVYASPLATTSDLSSSLSNGGTVVLTADVTDKITSTGSTAALTLTNKATLDLAGNTLTIDSTSGKNNIIASGNSNVTISNGIIKMTKVYGDTPVIKVNGTATLTLSNVIVDLSDTVNDSGSKKGIAVNVMDSGSKLKIENSTIIGATTDFSNMSYTEAKGYAALSVANNTEVEITNSTIEGFIYVNWKLTINSGDFTKATFYKDSSNITVYGGTFASKPSEMTNLGKTVKCFTNSTDIAKWEKQDTTTGYWTVVKA